MAVLLLLAGLFLLGMRDMFRTEWLVETYFDSSVQGLEVGSPLKYLGVKVGSVKEIGFVYEDYDTKKGYVLVRMAIDPSSMGAGDEKVTDAEIRNELKDDIAKGFRIKLASQGITGVGYLEAGTYDPRRNPPLSIDWTPRYPFIPSSRSTIQRVSSSLDAVMENLREVDFAAVSKRSETLLASVENVVTTDVQNVLQNLNAASESMPASVDELTQTLEDVIRRDIQPAVSNIAVATRGLPQLMQNFQTTVRRLNLWVADKQASLDEALENMRLISGNIEDLTDNARDYPSQVLFGNPPPKSTIMEDE
jgi:phospholipid/cholesterol/gamma-HCH transport system substrate-binding protein/paraquat-inducible protein B